MADANSGSRALAAASQLEKIGFVDFTVDLVKGVYEVIVNASMEQLEAYAELVTKVSSHWRSIRMKSWGRMKQKSKKSRKLHNRGTGI